MEVPNCSASVRSSLGRVVGVERSQVGDRSRPGRRCGSGRWPGRCAARWRRERAGWRRRGRRGRPGRRTNAPATSRGRSGPRRWRAASRGSRCSSRATPASPSDRSIIWQSPMRCDAAVTSRPVRPPPDRRPEAWATSTPARTATATTPRTVANRRPRGGGGVVGRRQPGLPSMARRTPAARAV